MGARPALRRLPLHSRLTIDTGLNMKAIYAFILAFLVSYPMAYAVPLSGSALGGGFSAFGTLADANNPVEMACAPEYTRLAVVRHRTANFLKSVAASKESNADLVKQTLFAATQVQQFADDARAKLDGLCQSKVDDSQFRYSLDEVRYTIKRAEIIHDSLIKGK